MSQKNMDLFQSSYEKRLHEESPLAHRMRPRTLDEYVGQKHIVGPGRLLRRAIEADQISSLIFHGPPGTGKTTLATVIANTTKSQFVTMNAVLAGVKQLREAIKDALEKRKMFNTRTTLFIDEVHRFNKAQQDALLPWVENGTVILIGATTENPYFEVNKALVSRSRLFQLKPLGEDDLKQLIEQTLQSKDRGYGNRDIKFENGALQHLVNTANGDARILLNAIELAVETTPVAANGIILISLQVAEESIQKRAILYDKDGDAHFDTISAFIKSLRGSDPDAALYWLARMDYAGEDPRFLFRRMVILASEDVGLADPNAIQVVTSCATAFDRVGMPEGRFHLAQAALYLATAPKSNSTLGYFDALKSIKAEREAEIPSHIKDSNRDKQGSGHGVGYLYPHAYRDHWVAQQYLPKVLQGQVFYQPSDQGYEAQIKQEVSRKREAQIAALHEGSGWSPPEILTVSPDDPALERWIQRTQGQKGKRLASIRASIFEKAQVHRHHVLCDLNAGQGLLTWEAIRQCPEGGVYALIQDSKDQEALEQQAQSLASLQRPVFFLGAPNTLQEHVQKHASDLRFDRIIGRNALLHLSNKTQQLSNWLTLLQDDGVLCLAESLPQQTQRLYNLLKAPSLEAETLERWKQAEEEIYSSSSEPMLNWLPEQLKEYLEQNQFTTTFQSEEVHTEVLITSHTLEKWFQVGQNKPSYQDRLASKLSHDEIKEIKKLFRKALCDKKVLWQNTTLYITARKT